MTHPLEQQIEQQCAEARATLARLGGHRLRRSSSAIKGRLRKMVTLTYLADAGGAMQAALASTRRGSCAMSGQP